jgi:hypothetical protein
VRGDLADELLDPRLRVCGSATGSIGKDEGAKLAQQRVAATIRLGLINPGLAFLSCFLGLLS